MRTSNLTKTYKDIQKKQGKSGQRKGEVSTGEEERLENLAYEEPCV
jgi:hypothetical protein